MLNGTCSFDYIAVLDGVFLVIVMLLSLFQNTIILLVMYKKTAFHTPTDVFLGCLSVADIFISLGPIPLCFAVYVYCWLPAHVWKIYKMIDILANVTSITSLCVISCDRFYIISFPYSYERNMRIKYALCISTGIWVYGITISLTCLSMSEQSCVWFVLTTSYFIPTIIMILCYVKIAIVAKRHAKHIFSHQVNNTSNLVEARLDKVGVEVVREGVSDRTESASDLDRVFVQKIYNRKNDISIVMSNSSVELESSITLSDHFSKKDYSRSKSLSTPAKINFFDQFKRRTSIWRNEAKERFSVKIEPCRVLSNANLASSQLNLNDGPNSKYQHLKKPSISLEAPEALKINSGNRNEYGTMETLIYSDFKEGNKNSSVEVVPHLSLFSNAATSRNKSCSLGLFNANNLPDEIPNFCINSTAQKENKCCKSPKQKINVRASCDCNQTPQLNNDGLRVPETNKLYLSSMSLPELSSNVKCNEVSKPKVAEIYLNKNKLISSNNPKNSILVLKSKDDNCSNYNLITLPLNFGYCISTSRINRANSAPEINREKKNSTFASVLRNRYILLSSAIPWQKESIRILGQIRKLRVELKAALMLAAMMGLFLCLWTPYVVFIIRQWKDGMFLKSKQINIEKIKYYKFIYYCSATANPACLVLMYSKWRQAFTSMVRALWKKAKI